MRSTWLFGLSLSLLACGGSTGGDGAVKAPPASSASAAAETASAAPATSSTAAVGAGAEAYVPPAGFGTLSPAPAPLAASVRDPKLVKLAKAAAACKSDEDGALDSECKAFAAWTDEEAAFEKNGNITLLSLLEDPDPKLRYIAAWHRFANPEDFFADKTNARRLLAIAAKESDKGVAHQLGELVTYIDAEKLDLKSEFFALTNHPEKKLRETLAFYLLGRNASAFNLVVAERLMNDSDERVQEEAVSALSTGGITKGTDGVCKLMAKELKRTDAPGAEVHWAAGTSHCGSVFPALMESLEQRVANMKDDKFATKYALAARSVCKPRPTFDDATLASMRKRMFAVERMLAAPGKDPNDRGQAILGLVDCDPVAARPVLEAMTKETGKDDYVAKQAQDALKELK